MPELKEGDEAPDFTLPKAGEGTVSLRALRGKEVVLYFYPKDDTSGCTAEARNFRDAYGDIQNAHAVVLGVSPDGVASHDRFAAKYQLPFTLLADQDHKVAEQYGSWGEKSMYGKKYVGILRSTFLISREGKIQKIWLKVNPEKHSKEVLQALEAQH